MTCPKCGSPKTQPISEIHFYCVNCNHTWSTNNKEEPKGTLDFTGAVTAKRIFEVLTKDQEFTPEFRAALETQITAIIFEQWFEGFKAGQMASILYAREHYGKGGNDVTEPVRESEARTPGVRIKDSSATAPRETSGSGRPGQRRRAEDGAAQRSVNSPIRERVGSIELVRSPGVVPENVYRALAYVCEEKLRGTEFVTGATFDGKRLMFQVDYGKLKDEL